MLSPVIAVSLALWFSGASAFLYHKLASLKRIERQVRLDHCTARAAIRAQGLLERIENRQIKISALRKTRLALLAAARIEAAQLILKALRALHALQTAEALRLKAFALPNVSIPSICPGIPIFYGRIPPIARLLPEDALGPQGVEIDRSRKAVWYAHERTLSSSSRLSYAERSKEWEASWTASPVREFARIRGD